MTDSLTPERRRWNMSRVRSGDTKPEFLLRSLLHRAGVRFRLHRHDLPGKPDLVLPRHRLAIFVHGCFWHRHPGCRRASTPSSNRERWLAKFAKNQQRDAQVREALEAAGWRVHVVWECELMRSPQSVAETILDLVAAPKPYALPGRRELLKVAEAKFREKFDALEN
ncbi:MAG: very short patch repair endonuclease [candidate division KSB1 bacterium]|nr:very short patch repair endonuclease [candidate division KSB1 bacterium]